jgi:translation initiation factor eIF-2B subunit gamma
MLRVDLQEWDEDRDSECEALRNWADKSPYKVRLNGVAIYEDLLNVYCLQRADLIVLPPDFLERFGSRSHLPLLTLSSILDRHRLDEPLLTTLISEKKPITNKKQKERTSDLQGGRLKLRKHYAAETPLVLTYDAKSSTLLDIRDADEYTEDVSVRNTLLEQVPVLSLSTKLELSHVYVCSRHILQVLNGFPGLRFFEEQALRWLCKMQWQKKLAQKVKAEGKSKRSIPHSQAEALKKSTMTDISGNNARPGSLRIACIIQR